MAAGGGRADRTMFALAARCPICQRTFETRDMVEETGRVNRAGRQLYVCIECHNSGRRMAARGSSEDGAP